MKKSWLAPLCSAFVLPGLGQIINRQIKKGVAIIAAGTVIFLVVLVKILVDLSAVIGQVITSDLAMGDEKILLILAGMRARDLTILYIFLVLGAALWIYSIVDAYWHGKSAPSKAGES